MDVKCRLLPVDVVEDGEADLPAVWLWPGAAGEGPGVLPAPHRLRLAVLPAEGAAVAGDAAARPEVGGAVPAHQPQEVLGLLLGVQRHEPHAPGAAVGHAARPVEVVTVLAPRQQVVLALPLVVTLPNIFCYARYFSAENTQDPTLGLELDWTALGCLCSCWVAALAGAAVVAGAGAGLRATARPKESTTKDLICRGFLVVVVLAVVVLALVVVVGALVVVVVGALVVVVVRAVVVVGALVVVVGALVVVVASVVVVGLAVVVVVAATGSGSTTRSALLAGASSTSTALTETSSASDSSSCLGWCLLGSCRIWNFSEVRSDLKRGVRNLSAVRSVLTGLFCNNRKKYLVATLKYFSVHLLDLAEDGGGGCGAAGGGGGGRPRGLWSAAKPDLE